MPIDDFRAEQFPDDDGIQFSSIDARGEPLARPPHPHGYGTRFSQRTRKWLTFLLGISGILLIVLIIPTAFPHAPTPSVAAAPTPAPDTLSVTADHGTTYVMSQDGYLHTLSARDGSLRWSYKMPMDAQVVAAQNGRVYVELENDSGTSLEVLNRDNGSAVWHYVTYSTNVTPVLVDDNNVQVLSTNVQTRTFVGLRASDGKQLWQYTLGETVPANLYITVNSGKLYLNIQFNAGNALSGANARLVVLQGSNGKLLWLYGYQADEVVTAAPVIDHDLLYIGTQDRSLKAVRASDGGLVWHYQPNGDTYWNSVVYDGVVYTGVGLNTVKALNAQNGAPLWSYKSNENIDKSPQEVNGIVYVETNDVTVTALRASDGVLLWVYTLSTTFPSPHFSMAADGISYIVSQISPTARQGTLYAIRSNSGVLLWEHQVVGFDAISPSPLLAANHIAYLDQGDNTLIAVREDNGTTLWRTTMPSHVAGTFTLDNDITYVSSDHATLEARRVSDGKIVWRYPQK